MIKKYVLFLAIGLTFSGNVNATTHEEFAETLNRLQKKFPIIQELRNDWYFQKSATVFLTEHSEKEAEEILFASFKENLELYIKQMLKNKVYWNIVEYSGSLHNYLKTLCASAPQNISNNT